jgi:ribosomal protein S18 acetylase RimI-like enzyme
VSGRPTPPPRPEPSPEPLLALFGADPAVHPYGLADVAQLWEVSRWWRRGEAAVGLLELPGSPQPVVYAVSARDPVGTLALLADLDTAGQLPASLVVTGPAGTAALLGRRRAARWSTAYRKLALLEPSQLPEPDPAAVVLDRRHLPALTRLYATDPAAGDFFHPGLLDTGAYLGILDTDGEVLASAGVHVLDRGTGVAAIGNVATHPDQRRRGLARRVTGTLCHRLLTEVDHVGLNVAVDNRGAASVYQRLGFRDVLTYEEAELGPSSVRAQPASPSPATTPA